MLTKDERDRIADYFEPWELVQLLAGDVDVNDLIDFLEDEIENALDDLNDIMEFKDGD
jgi:hypothetical protein